MADVTLYTFEDADGTPDTFSTFNAREAKDRGSRYRMRVIANTYEFADSETAWDFLPSDGEDEYATAVAERREYTT